MFDRNGGRKYLNGSERRAYYEAILTEPEAACRAFLLTLYHTGCRISEALNLVCGRVDFAAHTVIFETLKRRKRGCFRAVPVPLSVMELLRELVAARDPQERVWGFSRSTGYRMVKARMEYAGITGGMACPKGLRHGYAVACVTKEVPVTVVQRWLGHARLETTALYLNVMGEEERSLAERLW